MGIIAGILSQNVLKYLLNFGEVSYLLSMNAFLDFFDNSILLPNPSCNDDNCVKLQHQFNNGELKSRKPLKPIKEEVVHETLPAENEWGITIEENIEETKTKVEKTVEVKDNFSLDELKNQLGSLYKK
jgi:ubiquitin-like modifier-activating enzyme 5